MTVSAPARALDCPVRTRMGNAPQSSIAMADSPIAAFSPAMSLPTGVPRAYLQFGRMLQATDGVADWAQKCLQTRKFSPDDFQLKGIGIIARGNSAVVTGETGCGKTLVAEAAIDDALNRKGRLFYTSPKKALTNDKFQEFNARWPGKVGIMTGDITANPDAPIILMTTEVLRNMVSRGEGAIKGQSPAQRFKDLLYVVFDEAHYISDEERGPAWEEAAIFSRRELPNVQAIHLSATMGNAQQYTDWLNSLNPTSHAASAFEAVHNPNRAVPVTDQYLTEIPDAGNAKGKTGKQGRRSRNFVPVAQPANVPTRVKLVRILDKTTTSAARHLRQPTKELAAAFRHTEKMANHHDVIPKFKPLATVRALKQAKQLPALAFVFSQNRCEEFAASIRDKAQDLDLVTAREQSAIQAVVDRYVKAFPSLANSPLIVKHKSLKEHKEFPSMLEAGVGFHHANMWPREKELVETLGRLGLLKVLFATSTMAEGINYPAKTVVITSTKISRDGVDSALTGSMVRQMGGRAGRRGMFNDMGFVAFAHPHLDPALRFSDRRDPLASFMDMINADADNVTGHLQFSPSFVLNLLSRLKNTDSAAKNDHFKQLIGQSFTVFQAKATGKEGLTRRALTGQAISTITFLRKAGYIDNKSELTHLGKMAQCIPWEPGLLIAKAIDNGILDALAPADLAGALSATAAGVPRREEVGVTSDPTIAKVMEAFLTIHKENLKHQSDESGLDYLEQETPVNPYFAQTVADWCNGRYGNLLVHSPGRTVRVILRTANLLQHIAELEGISDNLRQNAVKAHDLLMSGEIAQQVQPTKVELPAWVTRERWHTT